jgi:hypothetical protein
MYFLEEYTRESQMKTLKVLSNENLKSDTKIRNTARLSFKLIAMILMV